MRKLFIALTLLVCYSAVPAQQNPGTITGSLKDSISKQPLSLATISVYTAKDSALFIYRMSDPSGNFKITGLPIKTNLRVIITFTGYRVYRKEFQFSDEKNAESLGVILLERDTRSLDEVLIYSERPPVIVRNDTIEFNASSFKTLPTALVEDLLKKLPGVDIDRDGNIVVNGKSVSRIMVDGKDFFGGDPKVATRNLPANIIDKVQVMDDSKQLDRNPLLMKDELNQVINLKLKKSIKKGWFGKGYAGAGTSNRNEAGAIMNSFRDTLQVSMLAYTNNLNRSGFSSNEILNVGGFQRSGVRSISQYSSGGVAVNDISFGGIGEGILRSSGGGININYSAKNNFNANLMYFNGTSKSTNKINQNIYQYFNDTVLTIKEKLINNVSSNSHRLGSKIELTIDPLTKLWFQPSLTFGKSSSLSGQSSQSAHNFKGPLYISFNNRQTKDNSMQYYHEFSMTRNAAKKIPQLRLLNRLSFSTGDNSKYTDAITDFYTNTVSYANQLHGRGLYKLSSETNLFITKRISKTLNVNLSHSITNIKNKDDLNVYEVDNLTGKYEIYNPFLSNKVEQTGMRNRSSLSFNKRTKKNGTFNGGMSLVLLNLANKFEKFNPIRQSYTFLLPNVGFFLSGLNISYSASVAEPNVADLQPVIDNSNPVFQVLGNPGLVPVYSHNFSLNRNKYNNNKLLTVNYSANALLQNNAIIRERWVDSNGVQFTRPLNMNGIWNFGHRLSLRKQYKFSKNRSFSWSTGYNISYSRTFAIVNRVISRQYYIGLAPQVSIRFNWKDKIEITQSFNRGWHHNTYSNNTFKAVTVKTFYYTTDLAIKLPKKFAWESNFEFAGNNDITPGFSKNSLRWNAAINFQFLKEDKGNLKLSVYDLFKQNAGIGRVVQENYVKDTEELVLTRYWLLTFTFNIRNFNANKNSGSGKDAFFKF